VLQLGTRNAKLKITTEWCASLKAKTSPTHKVMMTVGMEVNMKFEDILVGSLIRNKKPYINEAFYFVRGVRETTFTMTDISSKFGFNCNYGMSGELKDREDAEYFEVVSVPKMIWLVIVGLLVNLVKGKKRNSI
jgi:hypothetical protein